MVVSHGLLVKAERIGLWEKALNLKSVNGF